MYYPKDDPDWIPLRDAVSKLDVELAPLIRAGLESEAKGVEVEIDRQIWAAAWSICDSCQTAVLTSQGSIVLLSKSLFTRERNDSPYGDLLKLDIGQLGSQSWALWAGVGESDPDDDRLSEEDLKRLLHPFYGHHVLISAEAFEAELAKQKARFAEIQTAAEHASTESPGASTSPSQKKSRGRPPKILDATGVYKALYPNGHGGLTHGELIDAIVAGHGPRVDRRTISRMLKRIAEGQINGQN
jgi:hypothetical protein